MAPETIEEMVRVIRIAPHTVSDMPELAISHGDADAGVAIVDLPPYVQAWLTSLDTSMTRRFGDDYSPFFREAAAQKSR